MSKAKQAASAAFLIFSIGFMAGVNPAEDNDFINEVMMADTNGDVTIGG